MNLDLVFIPRLPITIISWRHLLLFSFYIHLGVAPFSHHLYSCWVINWKWKGTNAICQSTLLEKQITGTSFIAIGTGKISIRSYNNQQMTIKFYMTLHCVRRLHQSGAQLENCLIFVQPPLLHSLKYGTESIEKSSRFRRCRRCRYGDMGHGRSGRRLARRSAVLLPRHGSHSRRFPVPASGDLSVRHHFWSGKLFWYLLDQ